ncbi:ubiquitin-conjugating enzyme E2-24 kDa [Caerostris extrusa]|uniref:E2 ubiquitin-conjugating enzyme n=1 Tax=Caerostris extrusa TaxID=172846 RepID=A0AAV4NTV6_CAEEX|nr:ubiquitin-conjugating enzyme E2-24 kDa [Caerostris extrusa]
MSREKGDVPASISSNCTTNYTAKRLQQELVDITSNPPPLCSAGLKGDNLFEWIATIVGPPGSVYEEGIFKLNIKFSKQYPFKPPYVYFKTKIYHCNIDSSGEVCLDILDNKWSPAITVYSLLLSICSLLSDCNPKDPLVSDIARLYLKTEANTIVVHARTQGSMR